MFDDIKGKRALVTGACGVIGKWIAETLHEAGATLALTDAKGDDLEAFAKTLGLGGDSFCKAADLTDEASIKALTAEIGTRWGAVDILVNNAGIYPSAFLLDTPTEEFDRIFSINLRAPFILSRELATQMVRKGVKGSIINISSGASRKMRRTATVYSTSKTALDRLTKGFAVELAEYGIRSNALEPGFAAGSTVSDLSEAHIRNTVAQIPLGRPSSREDVGNALLYLASDASSYVTGATLTVDGGGSIGHARGPSGQEERAVMNPATLSPATFPKAGYEWPQGKSSAFCFSVDVDAESPYQWSLPTDAPRRSARSSSACSARASASGASSICSTATASRRRCSCRGWSLRTIPNCCRPSSRAAMRSACTAISTRLATEAGPEEFARALDESLALFKSQAGIVPDRLPLAGLGDDAVHAGRGQAPRALRFLADGLRPPLYDRRRDAGAGALGRR
jgi:3-oxoacyl-[acyl-carrier protein] reductase